ncbi:hypothetical protein [Streptomyces sp. NPDC046985]|uniref:hypothetical protein n=1 Tax=Streptomyces sp. NPDC046985 TaxID=3155377 RepID=UPI0033D5466E
MTRADHAADADQLLTHASEALRLARRSSSGYLVRRLQGLAADMGSLAGDRRVAGLGAEIAALSAT